MTRFPFFNVLKKFIFELLSEIVIIIALDRTRIETIEILAI